MELSVDILALLFFIAAVAGFLDTLAGGGGLLTIPALMLAGAPPLMALGTNKLQGCMGTATSSFLLLARRKVHWIEFRWMALSAFLGSIVGTVVIQFVDTAILSFMIPCVLIFIAGYFIAAPYIKTDSSRPRMSSRTFQTTVIPAIGCYDGMFGPATGSFFTFAGVSLRSLELIKATAIAKPLNLATNLASLMVFLIAGQVFWPAGLAMMAGQMLGATLGSNYLFKINPARLRLLIVMVCFVMFGRYLYQTFF